MEDGDEEDTDYVSRFKSPSFSSEEITTILELIEKYRLYILNKSITGAACHAKDAAWTQIAKEFSSRCFKHPRSADSLKKKWSNMKRDSRRMVKNDCGDIDAIHARVVTLISEANNIGAIDAPQGILDDDGDNIENGSDKQKDTSNRLSKLWDKNTESEEDDNKVTSSRASRSLNFSSEECQVLLACVRKEKKHVFCKDLSSNALELKNQAWSRITDSYNQLSSQKRTTQVLRTKFRNLKQRSESFLKGMKHRHHKQLTNDEDFKAIKQEPVCDDKMYESDHYEDGDIEFNGHKSDPGAGAPPDPLGCVLNGNAGLGSSYVGSWNWDNLENKDIVKLKKELLDYQMETAKLERKRVEDAIQEDTAAREARATETALRVRAARLDAVAAAMKLPPSHPALFYPPEEARARPYLEQYQS